MYVFALNTQVTTYSCLNFCISNKFHYKILSKANKFICSGIPLLRWFTDKIRITTKQYNLQKTADFSVFC